MKMRATQLENGEWIIEFFSEFDKEWGSFENQQTFTSKPQALAKIAEYEEEEAKDNFAARQYASGIDYACGYRD